MYAPELPARFLIAAASNQGKTFLLSQLLTEVYKGKFSMIYIFSPSIHMDPSYRNIIKYVENKLEPTEEWRFDEYVAEEMERIISDQMALVRLMREEKRKPYHIAIIADDVADDPRIARNSKLLNSLYTRGRHAFISVFTLTQKFRALSPLIRLNASIVILGRINNVKDLESAAEELSLVAGSKEEFIHKYWKAVEDRPYSYLLIDLTSRQLRLRIDGGVL